MYLLSVFIKFSSEQGAYVGDQDIGRFMISSGLAVMATNNSTANISSLFPG